MPISHEIFLAIVAFVAGIVDTIAGGGGLITLPALLMFGLPPVTALGTCKLQAAFSEFTASFQFLRRREVSLEGLWIGVLCVLVSSGIGTIVLQVLPPKPVKIMVPCLLALVLVYYFLPKSFYSLCNRSRAFS